MSQSTGYHISRDIRSIRYINPFIDFTSARNNSLVCAVRLLQNSINSSSLSVLAAGFKVFRTHSILRICPCIRLPVDIDVFVVKFLLIGADSFSLSTKNHRQSNFPLRQNTNLKSTLSYVYILSV